MGYTNNLLSMGEEEFAKAAAEVGVDGLIAVDLPPEEGESFFAALRSAGIDPILLAAPTTEPDRLAWLAKQTRGFLYFVSLTGVTGARHALSEASSRKSARCGRSRTSPSAWDSAYRLRSRPAASQASPTAWWWGARSWTASSARARREAAVDAVATFVAELKRALS
jgi:tryptophan synthase alpha chain